MQWRRETLIILKLNFDSSGRVQKKEGLILFGRHSRENAIEKMIYYMG